LLNVCFSGNLRAEEKACPYVVSVGFIEVIANGVYLQENLEKFPGRHLLLSCYRI